MIDKLRRESQSYFVGDISAGRDNFITPFSSVYELKIESKELNSEPNKLKIYLNKEGSTTICFEAEDEMIRQLNLYFDWLDKKQNKLKF